MLFYGTCVTVWCLFRLVTAAEHGADAPLQLLGGDLRVRQFDAAMNVAREVFNSKKSHVLLEEDSHVPRSEKKYLRYTIDSSRKSGYNPDFLAWIEKDLRGLSKRYFKEGHWIYVDTSAAPTWRIVRLSTSRTFFRTSPIKIYRPSRGCFGRVFSRPTVYGREDVTFVGQTAKGHHTVKDYDFWFVDRHGTQWLNEDIVRESEDSIDTDSPMGTRDAASHDLKYFRLLFDLQVGLVQDGREFTDPYTNFEANSGYYIFMTLKTPRLTADLRKSLHEMDRLAAEKGMLFPVYITLRPSNDTYVVKRQIEDRVTVGAYALVELREPCYINKVVFVASPDSAFDPGVHQLQLLHVSQEHDAKLEASSVDEFFVGPKEKWVAYNFKRDKVPALASPVESYFVVGRSSAGRNEYPLKFDQDFAATFMDRYGVYVVPTPVRDTAM